MDVGIVKAAIQTVLLIAAFAALAHGTAETRFDRVPTYRPERADVSAVP